MGLCCGYPQNVIYRLKCHFQCNRSTVGGDSVPHFVSCECHRGGKNRGPTGTRTQGLSLPVRQLSCLANGRTLTFSLCLIRFVPESARNNGGTTRHAHFDARCPSREPTLSQQMSQGRKKSWPAGTRTQGLSLSVRRLSY